MPSSNNAFPPRSKTFSYSSANKTRIITRNLRITTSPDFLLRAISLADINKALQDKEVLRCVTRGDRAFPPALRLKRTAISTPAAASAFATASRSPPLQQQFIRRFLRNCNIYGRSKVWRSYCATLLRSLPTLD
ncbi:hypothetical protein L249_5687 [Ophiocordyceps polyrhachis-furcata BCC 54312]|uniref:Uncharacterized protein n=1 Tax=Ophiocordyceps polyrhachis-furcata BCC 54312 TaxID=1330021 RepID=A0A367L045_9HYPO|nr:hypothetical protein L249_5687 [Ophiocordyceps polyrhachis-furcata BCC 54312]